MVRQRRHRMGEREGLVVWMRWWGGGLGDLSHTRALVQATIACVAIVWKAWRPGPEPPPSNCLCVGAAAFTFRALRLLLVGLLDVCVLRPKVNFNRNKEEGKHYHGTGHV